MVGGYRPPPPFSDGPTLRINVNVPHLSTLLFEIAVQYHVVCNLSVWYLLLIGLHLHFWSWNLKVRSPTSRSILIFILNLVCFSCILKRNILNSISNYLIFYHKSKLPSTKSKKKFLLNTFLVPCPLWNYYSCLVNCRTWLKMKIFVKNMTFLCVPFMFIPVLLTSQKVEIVNQKEACFTVGF